MAVQLTIPYETLVELVVQLPPEQQADLLQRLMQRKQPPQTAEEWIEQLNAAVLHAEINEEPSIRREDWYGDDGR